MPLGVPMHGGRQISYVTTRDYQPFAFSFVPGLGHNIYLTRAIDTAGQKYRAKSADGESYEALVNVSAAASLGEPWVGGAAGSYVALTGIPTSGNATLYTSADGVTFTLRHTFSYSFLSRSAIVQGGGLTIAFVGVSASYVTSTDGITWTSRSLPSAADFREAAYANGRFVIGDGQNYRILHSADGISWTSVAGLANGPWGVAQAVGNIVLVPAEDAGRGYYRSTNSTSFTFVTPAHMASVVNMSGLRASATHFIQTADNTSGVATGFTVSTDGLTWTSKSLPSLPAGTYLSPDWMAVMNGRVYFRVFHDGHIPNFVVSTSNGDDWQRHYFVS